MSVALFPKFPSQLFLASIFAFSAACGESSSVAPDAGSVALDAAATERDAGFAPFVYGHVAPPAGALPESLQGATWLAHEQNELLPYWTTPEALGTPVGNFPTYRDMSGQPTARTDRRPRMIARQTYAYAVGYLLTGDEVLLGHAKAGVDWIMEHAKDRQRGGWHAVLGADGSPLGDDPKFAQDTAYCMLGLAAYFFVTRDPDVEAELLATRDLLFDPDKYWDAEKRQIKDGLSADMSMEVDQSSDGGSELVAQLDPINAFLLLIQPVLSEPTRREQLLSDLDTLASIMVERWFSEGIFWGISTNIGRFSTRHVDFGHTLKSFWMILEIDKRLPSAPYHDFLEANVHAALDRAYDADNGRWAKRPITARTVEYGSDWWIYAEADQLAGTLDLLDHRYVDRIATTAGNWLRDYVDTNFGGEIIPGIRRDGAPVYDWPERDTAKCNEWKNGYHAAEHALVYYLLSQNLAGEQAVLHFAIPEGEVGTFEARPYFFHGRVADRTMGDEINVGGRALREIAVGFVDLY